MAKRRYKQTRAETLLAALVANCQTEKPRLSQTVALLTALMKAPLGDVKTDLDAQHNVTHLSVERADEFRERARLFLRGMALPHPIKGSAIYLDGVIARATKRGEIEIGGNVLSVLAYQLVFLINVTGAERLRTCSCGRMFARIGRQKSCSPRCYKRVYMAWFRRKQEEDEELE